MNSSANSYQLADVGDRFIALAIDTFIVGAIGGIFGVNGGGFFAGGILGFIIGVGYQWYFLTQQNGQTPGKMLMGLRVIRTDGEPIRDADAVLRYIGYLINSAVMMIGWLWAAIDSDSQGWHDKIAGTYVVKVGGGNGSKRKNDTIYIEDSEEKRKNDVMHV